MQAAEGVADQLGPDDHTQNGHDDRVVLAHPVPQAGQDPAGPVTEREEHHDRGRNGERQNLPDCGAQSGVASGSTLTRLTRRG
jgi:hypothetical protein